MGTDGKISRLYLGISLHIMEIQPPDVVSMSQNAGERPNGVCAGTFRDAQFYQATFDVRGVTRVVERKCECYRTPEV